MSDFLSKKLSALKPYVPGEQPKERKFIKLNTNESPYPPSPGVIRAAEEAAGSLNLYSDPECSRLTRRASEIFGLSPEELIFTNGSDEALFFIFTAFGDADTPFIFPDVTYGFYPVFARLCGVPFEEKPLRGDFTVDLNDYVGAGKNIVIANPNAPTGISLSLSDIEAVAASNPENVVVIDEAYVDFGGVTALPLIRKYPNLIVVRTFSKSRSLAGGRLGFAAASPELIRDLNTVKYSVNPYNVNALTQAAGLAALCEDGYYLDNARKIAETRDNTAGRLRKMGFEVLPSSANFLFIKSPDIAGGDLYSALRERGILVRHFSGVRTRDWARVTVGTGEEMEAFLCETEKILSEVKK